MTAPKLPDSDAPAEEWGRFAVSIPGFRWPDSCPLPGFYRKSPDDDAWKRVPCIETLAWGGGECVPDPDHWAWEGWFLRLCGKRLHIEHGTYLARVVILQEPALHGLYPQAEQKTLGRAAIAAAASLGRWPGGEA